MKPYRNPWFTSTVILVMVTLLTAYCSAKADWYVGVGQSTFDLKGTGIWFVNELPHEINRRHLAGSFGYAFEPTSWIDLRLGYIDQGRVQADALAYWPDQAYAKGHGQFGCATTPCVPANRYTTSFTSRGLEFLAEPHYDFGKWKVSAGYGVAGLYTHGHGCVQNGSGPNPYAEGGFQFASKGCFPRDNPMLGEPSFKVTPTYSAGVQYDRYFLRYSVYSKASANDGIYRGISVVQLGFTF